MHSKQESPEVLELICVMRSLHFDEETINRNLPFLKSKGCHFVSMFSDTLDLMAKTGTLPRDISPFMMWHYSELAKTKLAEIVKEHHKRKRIVLKKPSQ